MLWSRRKKIRRKIRHCFRGHVFISSISTLDEPKPSAILQKVAVGSKTPKNHHRYWRSKVKLDAHCQNRTDDLIISRHTSDTLYYWAKRDTVFKRFGKGVNVGALGSAASKHLANRRFVREIAGMVGRNDGIGFRGPLGRAEFALHLRRKAPEGVQRSGGRGRSTPPWTNSGPA